jgi:GT2 family glycosyltransferase
MIPQPLISVITINYNQSKVTLELLSSLKDITYPNIEIIVVDNASPNDNPDILKEQYPEINLLKSDTNLGFAGGNNLGVRVAKGEFLLFLNNDTEVEPGFLEPMIELFKQDSTIGMISPKILFHHTPDTIQYAGYHPMNPYTMRQNLVGYRQKDAEQFSETKETYSIHGAAMMVPMSVIKEVGMMTEVYFLYYEEHDWCTRIKKAGYKVYYQPKSVVFHKESISTGKESPLKIYYIARNRILYSRRNSTGLIRFINFIYFNLIAFPKTMLQYLFKRRFDLIIPVFKGFTWNFFHHKNIHNNPKI